MTKETHKQADESVLGVESIEKIPKTIFELVDVNREAEVLAHFMQGDRWVSVFEKRYPELRGIQESCQGQDGCVDKYRDFLIKIHDQEGPKLVEALQQIRIEWEKISAIFLGTLATHFGTKWLVDKNIIGYVSVLPVHPRFLEEQAFFTGYRDISTNIETIAHEIVHFLWFKKWSEVFPEMSSKEFQSPHLVWRLSEIIDPIILQCHPQISELIKPKKWGYNSFKDIKIGDAPMTDYFKKIYLDSVGAGDDFGVTMKKLWEEAKKHEKEISGF